MNERPSHRSSRLLAALALITLVLAGRLAESFHAAESGHAICPEHGELLHVADAHGHAEADDGEAPSGPVLAPISASAEHDHCLLATLLWSSGATWMPVESHTVAATPARACVLVCREHARFSLPPLSFAPKHSPPARVV